MMRRPVSLSAPVAVRGRRHASTGGTIEVGPGRELGLGYDDAGVLEMAARDGQAGFNTMRWGSGNRALHGLLAVLITAVTHAAAIRVRLEEMLIGLAEAYIHERERFRTYLGEACDALAQVELAAARREKLTKKLADHGLAEPTSRWPVMAFRALFIVGDLTMTSVAMAVLNVPDRPFVSWLPFSELHVAAVPIVVGMFGAADKIGQSVKAHGYEPQQRPVLKIVAGTSLAGGLCLALSIAAVRSAYLASNGIPTLFGTFVGIQLGLFLTAVAVSTHFAHPYGAEWSQMERQERRAGQMYGQARWRAGQQASEVNALVPRFVGSVTAARAAVEAVSSDVVRQGHLYVRDLQHGQPEPTEEELYAGELPEPRWPKSVQELLDYPTVPQGISSLAAPWLVSVDDLDRAWDQLRRRRLSAMFDDRGEGDGPEPTPLHPVADGTDTSPEPGAA